MNVLKRTSCALEFSSFRSNGNLGLQQHFTMLLFEIENSGGSLNFQLQTQPCFREKGEV